MLGRFKCQEGPNIRNVQITVMPIITSMDIMTIMTNETIMTVMNIMNCMVPLSIILAFRGLVTLV